MREEEEETVSGGCRTRRMSEHVVCKLQLFGRKMAHLRTSFENAPVPTARERELQK